MKMRMKVTIWSEDLRDLCIEKKWYTRGNNKAYSEMLNKCPPHTELTDDLLTELTLDIEMHSDLEEMIEVNNLSRDEMLEYIAWQIANVAATIETEVE